MRNVRFWVKYMEYTRARPAMVDPIWSEVCTTRNADPPATTAPVSCSLKKGGKGGGQGVRGWGGVRDWDKAYERVRERVG